MLQTIAAFLPAWDARDQMEGFGPDSRRGCAGVNPVAMTSVAIPTQNAFGADQ